MTLKEISDQLLLQQLNLDKILKMDESQRNIVISLFESMMSSFKDNSGWPPDLAKISILYNTLVDNDYLITRREKNIENILNESQD